MKMMQISTTKTAVKSIIVNYIPETALTDYDESDRLYFEELSSERVLAIDEREGAGGIIVSVGAQVPNNLASSLSHSGETGLGAQAEDIDRANRGHQLYST